MKKKTKKDHRGFKRLLTLLGHDKGLLILSFVFAVVYAVTQVLIPLQMGDATTVITDGFTNILYKTGGMEFGKIVQILVIAAITLMINWIFLMLQNRIVIRITQRLALKLRNMLAAKIGRLPVSYFESRSLGDILSTITYDVLILTDGFQNFFVPLIASPVYILVLLIVMFRLHWAMALVVLISLPLNALGVKLVLSHSQKHFSAYQQEQGELDGQIEETLSGFKEMKLFNYEEQALGQFRKANSKLAHSGRHALMLSGLLDPVTAFISNLGYVVTAIMGGFLAFRGAIPIGNIQTFISYVNSIVQPVQQLADQGSVLQKINAASERIFDFLDAEEEAGAENPEIMPEVKGNIRFADVKFGYVPEHTIIHKFNLNVKPGSHIAIVGPSGAGKSTLIKLLMRFYDIDGGSICVDGTDIRKLDRANLHNALGIVLQETWLFDGTILENVKLGRPEASDEEAMEAIRKAGADYFVNTLPGKEQFELKENGGNISAGQRQLLTIARAVLADRPILILDEATSSVDTQTERRIQDAMDFLMKGRTSFVIAHRLSTIVDADCILYLENGDVVEQGSHRELMEKNGAYRKLFDTQYL